jgi:hypothetical protein
MKRRRASCRALDPICQQFFTAGDNRGKMSLKAPDQVVLARENMLRRFSQTVSWPNLPPTGADGPPSGKCRLSKDHCV